MGQIDDIKEELNYMKVWLGIIVVTAIGLIGWLVNHHESASMLKTSCGIVVLTIIIVLIDKKIKEKIKSLREL